MLPVLVTDTVTPDLGRAVHYALLWGLEGVVLRTVGGPGERVPFVNEARVRARLGEAELPVAAVDPGLFEAAPARRAAWMNDLASFAESAAFCRRLGCGLVLTGALAEPGAAWDADAAASVLRQAGEAAARAGLRLGVRNEAGGACASGEALAALLGRADHPALGAAWSPADAAEAGHDPAAGLSALLDVRVPVLYVAVRDGEEEAGAWVPRTPGEGGVGWPGQLEALARAGFDGPLGLVVDGAPAAKAGLHGASALIAMARAAVRGARPAR
ncbi:MAG TPA: TIM barrel protein [Rubricoccaceae bacterium]|nr:TIM barrel protein [Rubricoccaceae bacterium]